MCVFVLVLIWFVSFPAGNLPPKGKEAMWSFCRHRKECDGIDTVSAIRRVTVVDLENPMAITYSENRPSAPLGRVLAERIV